MDHGRKASTHKLPSEFLFRLFRPSTWYNQVEVSARVDEFINKLIDDDLLVEVPNLFSCCAAFKTKSGSIVKIWIANFPYASGVVYERDDSPFTLDNYGCSIKTRYKLHNYIQQKRFQKQLQELNDLMDSIK